MVPPWFYTFMHPDAAIDSQLIARLIQAAGPYSGTAGKDGHDDHEDDEEEREKKGDD